MALGERHDRGPCRPCAVKVHRHQGRRPLGDRRFDRRRVDAEVVPDVDEAGVAPASRIALSVATKVNGLVITSSPGSRPSACIAATRAVVPLLTATAWRDADDLGELFSKRST